jgi:hypothetical protein
VVSGPGNGRRKVVHAVARKRKEKAPTLKQESERRVLAIISY